MGDGILGTSKAMLVTIYLGNKPCTCVLTVLLTSTGLQVDEVKIAYCSICCQQT